MTISATSPPVEPLNELKGLARPALIERWEVVFGQAPPKHMSRDLLRRALAHQLQEQAEGGLDPAIRRQLLQDPDTPITPRQGRLSPGTRLVREWHGRTHHVTVLEKGFEYRNTRYLSLSRIAREITGTRWSGPAFFGVHTAEPSANAD